MAAQPPKNLFPPSKPPTSELFNRDGEDLVDVLQLRSFHTRHLSLHTNGHVNNLVQELDVPRRRPARQGRRPPCQHTATARTCCCTTTGMSTTSKNCTWSVGSRRSGYLSLRNNWNVHHFDDKLDLRPRLSHDTNCWNSSSVITGTSANRRLPPHPPAQKPTVGAPGRRPRLTSQHRFCTWLVARGGPGLPPEGSRPDGRPCRDRARPPTGLCGRSGHHSRREFSLKIARSEPKPRPGVGVAG